MLFCFLLAIKYSSNKLQWFVSDVQVTGYNNPIDLHESNERRTSIKETNHSKFEGEKNSTRFAVLKVSYELYR